MKRPYLTHPPRMDDAVFCRWQFGWSVLPGLYVTASDWQHQYQREIRIHIDIGRGEPAKRQVHLTLLSLVK